MSGTSCKTKKSPIDDIIAIVTIPSGIEVHDKHAPYAPALIDTMHVATTRHFSLGLGLGSGLLGQLRAEVRQLRAEVRA